MHLPNARRCPEMRDTRRRRFSPPLAMHYRSQVKRGKRVVAYARFVSVLLLPPPPLPLPDFNALTVTHVSRSRSERSLSAWRNIRSYSAIRFRGFGKSEESAAAASRLIRTARGHACPRFPARRSVSRVRVSCTRFFSPPLPPFFPLATQKSSTPARAREEGFEV